MDTPKMITIQEAQMSQSGKTLRVKDQDGRWYSTKMWAMDQMVGQTIYAQTSESDYQGKPVYWINDYTMPEGQVGVPVPAMPQGQQVNRGAVPVNPAPAPLAPIPPIQTAVQHPQPLGMAQPVDRDASIVAQTLCKTISFSGIDQAWMAYTTLYDFYIQWRDKGGIDLRAAEANEQAQNQGQMADQEIPF